jgi:aspartate racemase
MGVRSTAPFLELIIEECQRQYGASEQPDYPQMIVFSWPTPFWVGRPLDHEGLRRRIADGLRWLERTGVDFMAMPANLAHLYFDVLVNEVGTPLLNLVEGVVAGCVAESGPGPVALLATRPVRDSGMYQRAFEAVGAATVADDPMQDAVDGLLRDLWAGRPLPELGARWHRLLGDSAERGATTALLACTDLNAITADAGPIPVLDATRLMARDVVAAWLALARERGML